MRISGLQKVTLLDYPGYIACTIFLGYCSFRCPYCHNMELVLHPEKYPEISIEEILKFLNTRRGKIDGVAITGGEPLINNDISDLIIPIKNLGFNVKLDTNGYFPILLKKLCEEHLIDMVAMDIKSGWSNYNKIIGINNMDVKEKINKSINIIKDSNVDYEFRTTCVKGLHNEQDFVEIADMIKGAKKYFLQNYKSNAELSSLSFMPFEKSELENFANIMKNSVESVQIRGI